VLQPDELEAVRSAPRTNGTVRLIVRRPSVEEREVVQEAQLSEHEGVVGDNWQSRGSRSTPDGSADREAQITVMNARAAAFFAGDADRWALAGDQLYVDFDLSEQNLPSGTRLRMGDAEIEVSAKPHTGCAKFASRFGKDALQLVSAPEGKALRLRGMNARVTKSGTVRVGDRIEVAPLSAPSVAD
jgi:MOSC domain-containing protein YiiM